MAALKTGTLDANGETFTLNLAAGDRATATMAITSTITVTWTVTAPGGSNAVTLRKSDDLTDAIYTATDYISMTGPGTFIATASSVTGGSCDIEARRMRVSS